MSHEVVVRINLINAAEFLERQLGRDRVMCVWGERWGV